MSMGRKPSERQADLWIATTDLPKSPGHVFYEKLNSLLSEAEFDRYVEELCKEYYAEASGRESIPPGVYFRMLFVGYFEELNSGYRLAVRGQPFVTVLSRHSARRDHARPFQSVQDSATLAAVGP